MTGAVLEGEADFMTGGELEGAVEVRGDGFGVEVGDGTDGDDGTG